MDTIRFSAEVPVKGSYDVIVCGGGVAGCAAALEARRHGKSALLIEKSIALGGLATIGLINYFVPMCNGMGTPICKGMAEEFLRLSIKYGYDTLPEIWADGMGRPSKEAQPRYVTKFSAPIFSMALTELMYNEGVDLLFDTVVSTPVMEGRICSGLVVQNKSGLEYYAGRMIVDTTGDSDVLFRAGVPTVMGGNFHTFSLTGATLESVRRTLEKRDLRYLAVGYSGGSANLYGGGHPEGKPYWKGTESDDVTNYVRENHIEALNKIKGDNRRERDILQLPNMPDLRTTRRIDGDATLDAERDAYRHAPDSVCAVNDFERNGYLYEVPLGCLCRKDSPNILTAGRSASGRGWGWDVLRVIPPAILTGQAAGLACALAIDSKCGAAEVDIAKMQGMLADENVMIHFDDELIPDGAVDGGRTENM